MCVYIQCPKKSCYKIKINKFVNIFLEKNKYISFFKVVLLIEKYNFLIFLKIEVIFHLHLMILVKDVNFSTVLSLSVPFIIRGIEIRESTKKLT